MNIFFALCLSITTGVIYWHIRAGREQEHLWDRIGLYHTILSIMPIPLFLIEISDSKLPLLVGARPPKTLHLIVNFQTLNNKSFHHYLLYYQNTQPSVFLYNSSKLLLHLNEPLLFYKRVKCNVLNNSPKKKESFPFSEKFLFFCLGCYQQKLFAPCFFIY